MKEIGGYIELEYNNSNMMHNEALALNCGRNCLLYLIRARKIKKIQLPLLLCDSVKEVCVKENIQITYYQIDENFIPVESTIDMDSWLYVVNYYGQLTNEYLHDLKKKNKKLIVDHAQAFFQMPIANVDTIYTCRKFFGVPDGAYIYTDANLDEKLERDVSYSRMNFLLGRFEKSANEFYGEYVENNRLFKDEDIKYMSKLTENLLRGIDYERVRKKRSENYAFLHSRLGKHNRLKLLSVEGAFMYPLYHENAMEIRSALSKKKIYIPTLWPNVLEEVSVTELEHIYAKNILPLPCDQRYNEKDMQYLIEEIEKCIS